MTKRGHRGALVGAGAALLCAAGVSKADRLYSYFTPFGNWGFSFSHMPDLDQVREGLPGNGGMYCVPTASMNMLAYTANHGFESVYPGPGYWQASSGPAYDEMTGAILVTGALMGTTASGGTGGQGWKNGVELIVNASGEGSKLDVITKWAGGNYMPTVREMALQVAMGGVVSFAYGRYDKVQFIEGAWIVDRRGGHAVTMQQAHATGPLTGTMWYRDPADSNDATTQSMYGSREMPIARQSIRLDWQPLNVLSADVMVIEPEPSDGRLRIVDTYVAIRPKAGYSFQPSTGLVRITIAAVNGFFGGATHTVDLSQVSGAALDLVVNAEQAGAFVLIDPDDGSAEGIYAVQPLDPEPRLVGHAARATCLTISPRGPLYAAGSAALFCLDPGVLNPKPIEIPIPLPACDIAFDSLHMEVVMLSPTGVLMTTPSDLSGPVMQAEIPAAVPLGNNSQMAVDPSSGKIWVITPGSDSLYGLQRVPGAPMTVEEVSLDEIVRPGSIDVDDKGTVFVRGDAGLLSVFPGLNGAWVVQPVDMFGDIPVGTQFRISRSITNFDPAHHVGPAFDHILPTDLLSVGSFVPDCPGDVVPSGTVDLADLNMVLAQFGAAPAPYTGGDATGDGLVTLADLNLVLAEFGVQCDL